MKAIHDFFLAAAETFDYLHDRWLDEQEHEDLADYALPLRRIAERQGVTVETMVAQPFGCVVSKDGRRFVMSVKGDAVSIREQTVPRPRPTAVGTMPCNGYAIG